MYEAQRASEWKYILENSDSKILITSKCKIYEDVKEFENEIPTLRNVLCFDAPFESPQSFYSILKDAEKETDLSQGMKEHSFNENFTASLIYTSGTTGRPKGVELTHKNLASNVVAIKKLDALEPKDASLCFLPWAHCYGQTAELHTLIHLGATISIVDDIKMIMQYFQEIKPTILFTVPTLLNKFYAGFNNKINTGSAIAKVLVNYALELSEKKLDNKLSFWEKIIFPYFNRFNKVIRKSWWSFEVGCCWWCCC